MDSYLTDRETLGKFVDELLAKKYPGREPMELGALREENIKRLDDEIGDAIFGSLDDAQLEEINALLDNEEAGQDTFKAFFENAGINLETKMSEAFQSFAQRFLDSGEELNNAQ